MHLYIYIHIRTIEYIYIYVLVAILSVCTGICIYVYVAYVYNFTYIIHTYFHMIVSNQDGEQPSWHHALAMGTTCGGLAGWTCFWKSKS